eukprot:7292541-Prymnesium_polylepis.1
MYPDLAVACGRPTIGESFVQAISVHVDFCARSCRSSCRQRTWPESESGPALEGRPNGRSDRKPAAPYMSSMLRQR